MADKAVTAAAVATTLLILDFVDFSLGLSLAHRNKPGALTRTLTRDTFNDPSDESLILNLPQLWRLLSGSS